MCSAANLCENGMIAAGEDAGGTAPDAGGAVPDAGGAVPDAPPDAQQCFGAFVTVCLAALPTAPVAVVASDLDIDTDTSSRCDVHTANYCVVAATSFSVAAGKKIRGHGSRPLILLSSTAAPFVLSGDIDVSSSHDGTVVGAGALSAALCAGLGSSPTPAANGPVGGFAGSFGGRGGDGGVTYTGTGGLAAPAVAFPTRLRGGCPGGTAGDAYAGGDGSGGGGVGGNGGGAIAVFATSIQLNGKINASGAGGRGGGTTQGPIAGGGGGGSGGLIILEAVTTGTGSLFANGGGGGGGGGNTLGVDGTESTGPLNVGSGGTGGRDPETGSIMGSSGGDGSVGARLSGGSVAADANLLSGGGGGGGAGYIRAPGAAMATISPPAM